MQIKSIAKAKQFAKKYQRGISVISVLLGLVIASVFAYIMYAQFTDSQRKARIEGANSEVATLIANTQKVFGAGGQYGSLETDGLKLAIEAGVIPQRMVANSTTAKNTYNADIDMTGDGTAQTGTLTYPIRGEDCLDVVVTNDSLTTAITVGSDAVKSVGSPLNMANAAGACAGVDSAANVDVEFTFGRM